MTAGSSNGISNPVGTSPLKWKRSFWLMTVSTCSPSSVMQKDATASDRIDDALRLVWWASQYLAGGHDDHVRPDCLARQKRHQCAFDSVCAALFSHVAENPSLADALQVDRVEIFEVCRCVDVMHVSSFSCAVACQIGGKTRPPTRSATSIGSITTRPFSRAVSFIDARSTPGGGGEKLRTKLAVESVLFSTPKGTPRGM